jgi:hypothetical protein
MDISRNKINQFLIKILLLSNLIILSNCYVKGTTDAKCEERNRNRKVCLGALLSKPDLDTSTLILGIAVCNRNKSEFCE